uniref:Putative phospholipase A1 magnifin n=1 Tax=Bactrocera dorsalis TaxID=27457 RepID=A0A034WKZ5_BACDO
MPWLTIFIFGVTVLQNWHSVQTKFSPEHAPKSTGLSNNNLPSNTESPNYIVYLTDSNEVNVIDLLLISGNGYSDEAVIGAKRHNDNKDDEQHSVRERLRGGDTDEVGANAAKENEYLQSNATKGNKEKNNKSNCSTKTTTSINNKKQAANVLSDKATMKATTKRNTGTLAGLSMRVNKNDFAKVGDKSETSKKHKETATTSTVTTTSTATTTIKTMPSTSTSSKRNIITVNNGGVTVTNVSTSAASPQAASTKLYHSNGFLNPFGQLVAFFGSDQLHLQDYTFFFNAERHTVFQLHTNNYHNINTRSDSQAVARVPALAETVAAGSERVLNVVTNTIGAVFGANPLPTTAGATANSASATTTGASVSAHAAPTMQVEEVQLYNGKSLRQSRFNPFNPTRILIHGWFGGANAAIYQTLVPAYLRQGAGNYNVFTVDWGRGAVADYLTASYRVKPVGKVLAKFIDFLQREAGVRFEDLHVIGFSMGAHIAGIAGKHVQTGRLPVIYALDPALPFFRYDNFDERVAITDADYVEVVHTSVGSYGYDRPLGHVDFYVNYGSAQPGCFLNECSHFRAFHVFAESLQSTAALRAQGCDVKLWQDMIKYRRCLMGTGRQMILGGDPANVTALRGRGGVFYLSTNAAPPYAKDVT